MNTHKFSTLNKKLKFEEAKKQIRQGDLFFTSGKYAPSEVIKKMTASEVSHVGFMALWNGRMMVFESVSQGGIRIVPLEHYLANYDNTKMAYNGAIYIARHKKFPQNAEVVSTFLNVAINMLAMRYDTDEQKRILLSYFGLAKSNDDENFLCSEFVRKCYEMVNIPFSAHNNKGFFYPEDIAADAHVEVLFEIEPIIPYKK